MFNEIREDLITAKKIMIHPYGFLQGDAKTSGAAATIRYYVVLSAVLAILNLVVNITGFPSDVIHASTNAQMAAYKYSPLLEQRFGVSRHVWTGC